jgi:ribonuclease BN (tRNA processing enzyme)
MHVTLFGTRGSLAAPGAETARYGGNTSSVEVRASDGTLLLLDAGTGIRRLGSQIPSTTKRVDILLTHLHMDHIQGLGFFTPLYHPGIEVHIWGPGTSTLGLGSRLSRYLSPPLFPVHLRDLPCVTCHNAPSPRFDIGPFRIRASLVCHPGPTLGYRIETDDAVVAYLPDHEPALALRADRWHESEWLSGYDLASGADLLIHDAQYTDEEYDRCIGWGHSSYRHAFAFAARAGVREIVPFHHDPTHDDDMLDRLCLKAIEDLRPAFVASPGREGGAFKVGKTPS